MEALKIDGSDYEVLEKRGKRSIIINIVYRQGSQQYHIALDSDNKINKNSDGFKNYRNAVIAEIEKCDYRKFINAAGFNYLAYLRAGGSLYEIPNLTIDDLPAIRYDAPNPPKKYLLNSDGNLIKEGEEEGKNEISTPKFFSSIEKIEIDHILYDLYKLKRSVLLYIEKITGAIKELSINLNGTVDQLDRDTLKKDADDFVEIGYCNDEPCFLTEPGATKSLMGQMVETISIDEKTYNFVKFEKCFILTCNKILPLNPDERSVDRTSDEFSEFQSFVKGEVAIGYLEYTRNIPLTTDGYFLKDSKEYIAYLMKGGKLDRPIPNWLFPPLDGLLESGLASFLSAPFPSFAI